MSLMDVTALRKAGRLDEALKMARLDLKTEKNNWTTNALFWVLRDLANVALEAKRMDVFNTYFVEMRDLYEELNDSEGYAERALARMQRNADPFAELVRKETERSKNDPVEAYHTITLYHEQKKLSPIHHEAYGWVMYRYLSHEIEHIDSYAARVVLRDYMALENNRPSRLHSCILHIASKLADRCPDFRLLPFMQMWDTSNFTVEDIEEDLINGRKIRSLVERLLDKLSMNLSYPINEIVDAFGKSDLLKRTVIYSLLQKPWYWKIRNAEKSEEVFALLEQYRKRFPESVASEYHSKVLECACWQMKEDEQWRFAPFLLKWGLANFRKEDFLPVKKEEHTYDSLVKKSVNLSFDYMEKNLPGEAIEPYIDLIRRQLKLTPDEPQIHRKLALLLDRSGHKQEALDCFRQVLLQLPEWYVWWDIARVIVDNAELKIALLAKALLLQKMEDFLGDVHLDMAEALIEIGQKARAARELSLYHEHRLKKGWKVAGRYEELFNLVDGIAPTPDNYDFYLAIAAKAEEFAYAHLPVTSMVFVASFKNEAGKSRMKFTNADGHISVSFSARKFANLRNIKPGTIVDFRLNKIPVSENRISRTSYRYEAMCATCSSLAKAQPPFPTAVAMVEHVNEEKALFRYVIGPGKSGLIHFNDTDLRPTAGSFLFINYYMSSGKEGKLQPRVISVAATDEVNSSLKKSVSGKLTVIRKNKLSAGYPDFGFVNDYYVPRHLLKQHRIDEDCEVKATAVFNGEKWQVCEIDEVKYC